VGACAKFALRHMSSYVSLSLRDIGIVDSSMKKEILVVGRVDVFSWIRISKRDIFLQC
jgi:hypothetical protein